MKERIEYLDLLKGISIILVIFCHFVVMPADTVIGNAVMSAAWGAVPCFFLVSGGVMHQAKDFNWKKYGTKLLRIYAVLCAWKLIYLITFGLWQEVTFSKLEVVNYLFLFGSIENVNTGVMWFMYAYLMVLLFYPVSYYLYRNKDGGKKVLLFVLGILFVDSFLVPETKFILEYLLHISIPTVLGAVDPGNALQLYNRQMDIQTLNPFGNWTNMLFFFLLGAFLLEKQIEIKEKLDACRGRIWIPSLLIAIGITGLTGEKYCETGIICWGGIYISNGYYRVFTLILAIGMYLLAQNWRIRYIGHVVAHWVGTETVGIYYLHFVLLAFFQENFSIYYEKYYSFGLNVLKTVIMLIVCTVLTALFRKIPLVRILVM
jgi:surface polysaccharide O-acyltransferase-like enzyme